MDNATLNSTEFLNSLTATQEHFLKKYLLETTLIDELCHLNLPNCCQLLGSPFNSSNTNEDLSDLPLLSFFLKEMLATFPFITHNSVDNQKILWQDTIQPFVESFNRKSLTNSIERKGNITKRKQISKKVLSGLLLFYNSIIITNQEMSYLNDESHLKPSDIGKLDKIYKSDLKIKKLHETAIMSGSKMDPNNLENVQLINHYFINFTSVRYSPPPKKSGWFSITTTTHSSYEFIIQVVFQPEGGETKHYHISKHYSQFRELEKTLKSKFPGSMIGIIDLPRKDKTDAGFLAEHNDIKLDPSAKHDRILMKEKLRLSLRGYLRSMISIPEIAHSNEFQSFISGPKVQLTNDDMIDNHQRMIFEKTLFNTQLEFQNQTAKVMSELTKNFEGFKQKLIQNPNTLTSLVEEIGRTPNIKDASPLLKTFNEWCKLEISATIYQMFIAQDNSYDLFKKVQKIHGIFPYSIVYGILKYTNPIKVVSKLVNLLLVRIPKLPSFWNKKQNIDSASEQKEAHNLLSMIFVTLLNEDLHGYDNELKVLEQKLHTYSIFLEKLNYYSTLDSIDVELIEDEALALNADYLITILSTSMIKPNVSSIDPLLQQVRESYEYYSNRSNDQKIERSLLYSNLKQYWHIQMKKKDINLVKQLWQEPELTNLIKKFLEIFYQPLIDVFAKSNMHLVFRSMQKFLDDLIQTLKVIHREEIYYLNHTSLYNKIKTILDDHETIIWNFIYDVYNNDDTKLFLRLVKWIEKFLDLIKIKLSNESLVTLELSTDQEIDKDLFLKQLDSRIHQIVKKRQIFKDYLESQTKSKGELENNWDTMNDQLFGNTDSKSFGILNEDLEDFNFLNAENNFGNAASHNSIEQKLRSELHQLESHHGIEASELDKLDIRSGLREILQNLRS